MFSLLEIDRVPRFSPLDREVLRACGSPGVAAAVLPEFEPGELRRRDWGGIKGWDKAARGAQPKASTERVPDQVQRTLEGASRSRTGPGAKSPE